MEPRLVRDSLREYELLGKAQITLPYAVYLEVQRYLTAIGSGLKPDDLITDIVRGYLREICL